ncbi:DUF4440 domain-containing protein [Candidatus Peribacteria bacterium]|nr:MAG: DUF4440 domain-containing protein [Candidatus Peribacteria bacterium]
MLHPSVQNFARWQGALLSRDPHQVADLYADNATLIPTMFKKMATDHSAIVEYFTFFTSLHPEATMLQEEVIPTSDDCYLHCGVYRFKLTVDGSEQEVDARFTMMWQKVDNEWNILHHHSSRNPAS